MNQDRVAGPLREIAIALGLPAPQTHVSGMFTFQRRMLALLEGAGFTVDCSLLPGIPPTRHPASGPFVLADNSRHADPYPYHPSRQDPWSVGDSHLVEIPVSGNLGCGNLDAELMSLRQRLNADPDVDVFQVYWHHFEFGDLGWTQGKLEEAERFLVAAARLDHVVFSTACQAARDFSAGESSARGNQAWRR